MEKTAYICAIIFLSHYSKILIFWLATSCSQPFFMLNIWWFVGKTLPLQGKIANN